MNSSQIELLAPAGNLECIRAAIENGADAVYFGVDIGFNARARADNISLHNLPEVMRDLHGRCVRGYVTLNTLVFCEELQEFESIVRKLADASVDAVLVQDLGAAKLIRKLCPALPIHASTQMTMTSAETIAEIEALGIDRVVVARELSIHEIENISKKTSMPLEVFAHGALCVAYSGQCMTSESFGGRSANRGQCAQACRLPYELVCDGKDVPLEDQRYLLSPQDLAAYELIPELIAAGICSLKIEGRLKTAEYVANITKHYRQAIDAATTHLPLPFDEQSIDEMELSFSRGFSPGWLKGCDHKMLVPGQSSAKRGIFLGTVQSIQGPKITITAVRHVKPGDGVAFADASSESLQGGRVFQIHPKSSSADGQRIELTFGHNTIDSSALSIGQSVWKTDDPALTKRLRKSFSGKHPKRKVPVKLQVRARSNGHLLVTATARDAVVQLKSSEQLPIARQHGATAELFHRQFGRLGNTAYALESLSAQIEDNPMVPLSVLGKLRREMVTQLDRALQQKPIRVAADSVLSSIRPTMDKSPPDESAEVKICVLCRTMDQLETVIANGISHVLVDFADIRQYSAAVQHAHEHSVELFVATPRIQKPGEMGIFHSIQKQNPQGVLARNLSGIRYFLDHGTSVIADFSLNVANEITASLIHQMGVQWQTPSYDLNRDQLLQLLNNAPPSWFEVVIHQHMPMFHMEHCVFCSVLSPGTNKTNCGRPCDFHSVKMRDRVNMEHTLLADVGCRNTLFNAKAQSAAEIVPRLITQGIKRFRIELLDQSSEDEILSTINPYKQLISGRVTGKQVWTKLQASNRVGVTRGTLEEKRNPLAIL